MSAYCSDASGYLSFVSGEVGGGRSYDRMAVPYHALFASLTLT
jgi:hypothetical protein